MSARSGVWLLGRRDLVNRDAVETFWRECVLATDTDPDGGYEAWAFGDDTHPDLARQLLAVGESAGDEQWDAAELAAWTMIANMVLNLDEAVTKG